MIYHSNMLQYCNTCKSQFKSSPSENKKFCSTKCYWERNGKSRLSNCKNCQKEILLTPTLLKKGREYCSLGCWREIQTNRPAWNANPIMQKCLVCNKKFKTIAAKVKVGKGKFCSKECYLKDHVKNTWSVAICKGCHRKFKFMTYRKQTCCSLKCNSLFRWKDNIERWNIWDKTNISTLEARHNLRKKVRKLSQYKMWREQVLVRDKYMCVICHTKEYLIVDHIKSLVSILWKNNIVSILEAIECPLLWDIKNGQTLCKTCHLLTETYGVKSIIK